MFTIYRLRDEIDERHKAEDALKQTQEELIQAAKMAVLGQISAGINHELNQPLTAIRSYTQNAQQFLQRGNIETADHNLTEIINLTDHMASIVGQLKVFSRKRGDSLTPVDVLASLNDAVKIMSPQVKQHHVKIIIHSSDQPYTAMGDLIRLEQVFINLISNAIHAMSHSKTRQVSINLEIINHHIVIHIEDTGPGIASNNIKHVFEPFFTTKDISQGLGLGLSISHRIIEAMHGTLNVENSASGGAIFSITLPEYQPPQDENEKLTRSQEHPID